MSNTFFTRSGASPPILHRLAPSSVQIPHVGFRSKISRANFQFVEVRPDARIRAFAGSFPARAGV
jgi:hypothetical protein